jgi:hypothetical protein
MIGLKALDGRPARGGLLDEQRVDLGSVVRP